jgi:SAM-dependent methyltransferase
MRVAAVSTFMGIRTFKNLARMTAGPIEERGLFQTARSAVRTLFAVRQERLEGFDARYGTDTGRHVTMEDLAAVGPDVPALWRYAPTLVAPFRRMMAALPVAEEELVFVDLGSGKGRALLLASEYPFRRIVGVELSPKLHRIAQTNVERFHSDAQRCRSFELLCMDAAEYEPPPEPMVLYLFQPFPIDVLTAVLEHLEESLRARPRRAYIAYMNPLFDARVLETGLFERGPTGRPGTHGEFDWTIYLHR